jgi:Na+-driven multidrug efflux pump
MSRLRSSILLSAINNYGELLLTLLSITILSRLLTPHEFGVYAITASIPGVLSAVREFGGANYIIQKQDLSERCIRTSFTIKCAVSAALIALLFAIRDEMAQAQREAEIEPDRVADDRGRKAVTGVSVRSEHRHTGRIPAAARQSNRCSPT